MSSRLLRVSRFFPAYVACFLLTNAPAVIARSALAQEEAEEFNGEFSDPINIHLDGERDGCAC